MPRCAREYLGPQRAVLGLASSNFPSQKRLLIRVSHTAKWRCALGPHALARILKPCWSSISGDVFSSVALNLLCIRKKFLITTLHLFQLHHIVWLLNLGLNERMACFWSAIVLGSKWYVALLRRSCVWTVLLDEEEVMSWLISPWSYLPEEFLVRLG